MSKKKKFCEGPFGFRMLDSVAKEVDKMWKRAPSDCKEIGFKRVSFTPESIEFKAGERADVSLITSDIVDRDREVVLPQGIDWSQFRKNPVVPFGHKYDEPPVGHAQWVKRVKSDDANGWIAKTLYATKPDDWPGVWFADAVWHLVQTEVLKGKSIGFIPVPGGVRSPTSEDLKANPDWADSHAIIAKCLALEYSVVPVQSNPEALTVQVAKGLKSGIEFPDVVLDALDVVIPQREIDSASKLLEDEGFELEDFSLSDYIPEDGSVAVATKTPTKKKRFTLTDQQVKRIIDRTITPERIARIVDDQINLARGGV